MKLLTFANQQNVNADVMNIFYNTKDDNLTGYFNEAPCICFGIGNFNTTQFGQVGTTNQVVLTSGYVRFADQVTPVSGAAVQKIFTTFTGGSFNITVPTPAVTHYVCVSLTMTTSSSHVGNAVAALNTTAKLVGAINPLSDVVLFAIEVNAGVYTISIDSNCSKNYGAPITIMSITNRPIAGNVPISKVELFLQGDYTHAQINAYNGIANNFANVQTTYTDPGNGTFKPYSLMEVKDPAGYSANVCVQGAGSGNSYEGFQSQIYNAVNSTNYAILEMYPITGNPFSQWRLVGSGAANTGLELVINERPQVLGDLATLGTTQQAVVVLDDLENSGGADNVYQALPEYPGGRKIIILAGQGVIPGSSAGVNFSFPTPFPNGCIAATATITSSTVPSGYWITQAIPTASSIDVSTNSAVSGDTPFNYIAIGY